MSEKFKDITINGQEFRIDLLPADIGTWAVSQMSAGRAITDYDTYQKLQAEILNRCCIYKGGEQARVPMKIYDTGRWLVPDLQYDLDTIHSLCLEAMDFNFDPFFAKAKARAEASKGSSATSQ